MGMAVIVTPSRISHHFGISNEYGISVLPSAILTSRVCSRSKALRAEATLRSEPHSISWMAFARRSESLYGVSFLWMSFRSDSKDCRDVMRTVPLGTVKRLIGCRPYHAHDSTPLDSVSSSTIDTSVCLGS